MKTETQIIKGRNTEHEGASAPSRQATQSQLFKVNSGIRVHWFKTFERALKCAKRFDSKVEFVSDPDTITWAYQNTL